MVLIHKHTQSNGACCSEQSLFIFYIKGESINIYNWSETSTRHKIWSKNKNQVKWGKENNSLKKKQKLIAER